MTEQEDSLNWAAFGGHSFLGCARFRKDVAFPTFAILANDLLRAEGIDKISQPFHS
jgi:hypothetical protein